MSAADSNQNDDQRPLLGGAPVSSSTHNTSNIGTVRSTNPCCDNFESTTATNATSQKTNQHTLYGSSLNEAVVKSGEVSGGGDDDGSAVCCYDENVACGSTQININDATTSKRSIATSLHEDKDLTAAATDERDKLLQELERQATFFQKYKKILVIIPYIILNNLPLLLIAPFLPMTMKAYFGSDKTAAEITSYVAAATAFVGMFTAPFYGKLLDTIGRRLFFIISPIFQYLVPTALFLLFPTTPVPYMVANALGQLFQGSFQTSYIADNYSSASRVRIYAIAQAATYITAFAGMVNKLVSEDMCKILAIGTSVAASLYALLFIRESIPQNVKQPLTTIIFFAESPFASMRFLLQTKVTRALIAIAGCFMFAQVGSGDIFVYYANARIGFNTTDVGYLLFEQGGVTPLCMLVALPLMSKFLSPTVIIFITLAALVVELALVATLSSLWVVYAFIIPLVDFTGIMLPLLSTIMANTGSVVDQGRRLTGFAAVVDLCDALGPVFFGALYGNVSWTPLSFVLAAVMVIPAGLVALKLPRYLREDREERDAAVAEVVARGHSSRVKSAVSIE